MSEFILGKIDTNYTISGLTLIIDGEEEPTKKAYHYVSSYVPKAGDRVLIAEVGDSYVVLGKLITAYSEAGVAKTASSADTASKADSATKANTATTATTADKAEKDGSGNNIKSTYAASISCSNAGRLSLKNKNGSEIAWCNITASKATGIANQKQGNSTVYLGVLTNTLYWSTSQYGPWYKVRSS